MPFIEELVSGLILRAYDIHGNIFYFSKSQVPAGGDGPFTHIREYGGRPADETHNEVLVPAYVRPSAQINIHAKSAKVARDKAWLAYKALRWTNEEAFNGTWYRTLRPFPEPHDAGLDPSDRVVYTFNVAADKEPS